MRKLLFLPTLAVCALALMASTAFSADEPPPPKKVWVCHFSAHTPAEAVTYSGGTLDHDWVMNNPGEGQQPNPNGLCQRSGGEPIYISEHGARNGHGALLADRIDSEY